MDRKSRAEDVEDWIRRHDADQQAEVSWFADLAHAAVPGMSEAIKWRRLTFTVDDNWHHWVCAVNVNRAGVSVMLHKGALLDDPGGLLEGDGKYLRQIPMHLVTANPDAVAALLREAAAHQTDM